MKHWVRIEYLVHVDWRFVIRMVVVLLNGKMNSTPRSSDSKHIGPSESGHINVENRERSLTNVERSVNRKRKAHSFTIRLVRGIRVRSSSACWPLMHRETRNLVLKYSSFLSFASHCLLRFEYLKLLHSDKFIRKHRIDDINQSPRLASEAYTCKLTTTKLFPSYRNFLEKDLSLS